jgi:hypothetical protein
MKYILLIFILLISAVSYAEDMPCIKIQSEFEDNIDQKFTECMQKYLVCIYAFDGSIVKAQKISELRDEVIASGFGIIQTSPTYESPVCLAGTYSGGSSAAWFFQGWQVKNGTIKILPGMDKGTLNSDAVSTKELANTIYETYTKYGK